MRIGELADRVGVKPATVRYYETIGLLPTPARTAAGYRDYDQAAVVRLGFVRAAQGIGLSLGEVREVLALRERGQTPCRHVQTLIEQRAAELADQIAELETMRAVSWSSWPIRRVGCRPVRTPRSATSSRTPPRPRPDPRPGQPRDRS